MNLREWRKQVEAGRELGPADAAAVLDMLQDGGEPEENKTEFLIALTRRGETVGEMAAFASRLRDLAVRVEVAPEEFGGTLIDVCGTGGDGRNTFNVSTCAAFLLASAGLRVAKHGNRGVTSRSGAFDVLDVMGIKFEFGPDAARQSLVETGLCFLFAPRYHPVMRVLAPVRKAVAARGSRTIFNFLGPAINPARPNAQVVGVPDPALPRAYVDVLKRLGLRRAIVVCGRTEDGKPMDEMSVLGTTEVSELAGGRIEHGRVQPGDFHWRPGTSAEFTVGSPEESAKVVIGVLSGEDTTLRRDLVLLNAAAGFKAAGVSRGFRDGIEAARNEITSGRAIQKLLQVREVCGRLAAQAAASGGA